MKIAEEFQDKRPWIKRTGDFLLRCLRVRVEVAIGQIDLVFRIRDCPRAEDFPYMQHFALVLRGGFRQIGIVLEQRTVKDYKLRLHGWFWYYDFTF